MGRGRGSITAQEPCDHLTHMAYKKPIGSAVGEGGGEGGGREGVAGGGGRQPASQINSEKGVKRRRTFLREKTERRQTEEINTRGK